MAITKQKKQEIVSKLKDVFKGAKSVVFVNFKGLSVSLTNEMRRTMRTGGVSYFVAKKNLVSRVLSEEKFEGEAPAFPGELAIAWGDDLVAPAREVYGFQSKNPTNLNIVGGVFEGRFMDQKEMMEIATIPPMPVLYGKFVNVINAPIQGLVIALSKIAEKKS